jgi:hypothetical protein
MKNNSLENSNLDRAATFDEVRIATLLQCDSGLVSADPNDYYCDVISETGQRSRVLWFDLEFFSDSQSNFDPTIN